MDLDKAWELPSPNDSMPADSGLQSRAGGADHGRLRFDTCNSIIERDARCLVDTAAFREMPGLYLSQFPHAILTGMAASTCKIPWYRPTFLRGLLALLAFEMFLLLAKQCRWFGLVKDSGGRELEALTLFTGWAAVVVACLVAFLWLLVQFGFRRRFQYSLRSLLLLTLLVSIGMSWVATMMQRVKRQREVARAIEKLGGRVWWDVALRQEAGFLSEVTYVDMNGEQVRDEALQNLSKLPRLARLNLNNSDITDSQLRYLKGLAQLRLLELEAPRVTDEAVKELQQALPNCQIDR